MIAISFLGLGQFNKDTGKNSYSQTKYMLDNIVVETPYFPFVVNQICKPESTFILMTEEANNLHSAELRKLFRFNEVRIQKGKNEEEIWDMFDCISQCVNDNDEVILDITYGFRSQPIIAIASLLYLKVLKNIKIRRILYGAFEAREIEIVPVFDLKQFIDIVEWSYSVNEFLKTGKAKSLNKQMKEIHSNTYLEKSEIKSEQLAIKGKILNEITQSLSIVNIKKAFNESNEFPNNFELLLNDLEKINSTKPLSMLLGKILKFVEPISIAEKNMFNSKGIDAQLSIIQWYIDTEQFQQAITLMNELFITLQCKIMMLEPIELENRQKISKDFGKLIDDLKTKSIHPKLKEETVLWNRLSEIRNEINHAGMKENNTGTSKQIKNIIEVYEKLNLFYLKLKIQYADKFI